MYWMIGKGMVKCVALNGKYLARRRGCKYWIILNLRLYWTAIIYIIGKEILAFIADFFNFHLATLIFFLMLSLFFVMILRRSFNFFEIFREGGGATPIIQVGLSIHTTQKPEWNEPSSRMLLLEISEILKFHKPKLTDFFKITNMRIYMTVMCPLKTSYLSKLHKLCKHQNKSTMPDNTLHS